MPEQQIDVTEQIQKMGEKWSEFQETWVSHFKDMEVDVLEWNFGVGKIGGDTIFELKAKVAVRQKK
jgi:ABC-type antimicrobial peptide transport system permease subunit